MLSSPLFQIAYLVGTTIGFLVVTLATRAPRRRVFGAVCAIVVFTALSAPIDNLGARWNLWRYPGCHDPPHPSIVVYLGQATIFVGSLALIGWRVQRAFGARGLVTMTIVVLVVGCIRDFTAAAIFPDVMVFGPMPGALLADAAAWAVVLLVALVVPRIVSGPARA
jgi:hypothetical protein